MFTKAQIELFSKQRTPFWFYDTAILRRTLDALNAATHKRGYHVHYALKANANETLLDIIREAGIGADCVSGNEVLHAIRCGFSAKEVVFAGVGKSDAEINAALDAGIFCFNCESRQELEVINALASAKGTTANIALRINPNVNANTHRYITTGLEENKFGINLWELDEVVQLLQKLSSLKLIGLHFHIGSQITDLSAFKSLCLRVNEIQEWFVSRRIILQHVNLGGGLGLNYHEPDTQAIPDFETFFALFEQFLEPRNGQDIHFELGRAIVGQCGSLISRVLYVKNGIKTNFTILDAGMTELIRPALYQSYHKIENLSAADQQTLLKYDVVGPICESSDCFGKAMDLPETKRGDLVAIRTAGAYGSVMASRYNLRDEAGILFG